MDNRLAIVIAVDGLRASALGTYGNTTYPTPFLDLMASRSVVVEWLLAESPQLAHFYRSAWAPLLECTSHKWLVSDADIRPFAPFEFNQSIRIDIGDCKTAGSAADTHVQRFFAQVVEQLATWRGDGSGRSSLLWIHFSGLCGPWDAPLRLREEILDDDELDVPTLTDPPASLATDYPDDWLCYRACYGAQVALLDSCLAGFIDAIDAVAVQTDWLAMVVGTRGFSWGEHGLVGYECQTLYSEQIHLPWIIFRNGAAEPLPRAGGFAHPADVGCTLYHWLTAEPPDLLTGISLLPAMSGQPVALRDVAIATDGAGNQVIRTPAWLMKQGELPELYAKPDDRWEANNVASRCPNIAEKLSECLHPMRSCHPLPPELTSLWR